MAETCCKFAGDLDLGLSGCIISISTSCSTEFITACGEDNPVEGPTIGSLNITGYGSETLWQGCACRAGVSIPFVRRYDCDNDVIYFIFSGQGQSFYTGEANRLVSVNTRFETECTSLNASSQGGPASIYTESTQVNGYGMTYNGLPIPFTTNRLGTQVNISNFGSCYLQNFSLELQPGQLPVANYSFVYSINTIIIGG